MKFVHTADWHLGKLVHNHYMTEDQSYILNQLVEVLKEEKPDCLIIAGDIYDRPIPPVAAVELLNEILYKINVELNIPILAISGNHDSSQRLSFGSHWYRKNQLYMITNIEDSLKPITIKGVDYYLIPYCEPTYAKEIFKNQELVTHQDVFNFIIGKINEIKDDTKPNVLVAHAFVLGGEESDSERMLSVGGSSCVTNQTFEGFDYVALGHLHSPTAIKHERIFYSGSLLKYSFSEVKHKKQVNIVQFNEDKTFELKKNPLIPIRDMREVKGEFQTLQSSSFYETQKLDDYLKIVLTDDGVILDPMNRLKIIYPNILHLERESLIKDAKRRDITNHSGEKTKSEVELFKEFYEMITTSPYTEEKENIVIQIAEEVRKGELGE